MSNIFETTEEIYRRLSKVVDITFHCENCGYKLAIKKFRITFSDGEVYFGCQDCIAEYFAEIPEQIVNVEAI